MLEDAVASMWEIVEALSHDPRAQEVDVVMGAISNHLLRIDQSR